MFQIIFYNAGDQIQLPSNKLMDTVKIFGHLTEAVNGLFNATLGSTGVGFALLKNTLKFICHTAHVWPLATRVYKTLSKTCKQNKQIKKIENYFPNR